MSNITVKEVTNQKMWDKFVKSQTFYTFLQSWVWGEFLKLREGPIYRMGFFDANKLIGVALFIIISAKRGKFLFCPHGPILDWENKKLAVKFFQFTKKLGKENRCWFVRISSLVDVQTQTSVVKLFKNSGYRHAPIHMHAEDSWILNINKSDEEILAGMRKTARYLVKQGEKLKVKTEIRIDREAIEKFADMHLEHAKSNTYTAFSRSYLMDEWKVLAPGGNLTVLLSYYNQELLAAAVIVFYGAWAFYYQAVTQKSKIPAGYTLVWEAIKEARKRGCKDFNFWGVAPPDKPNHPWVGLSLFKQGFGGNRIELLHAQDLILSPMYWLTYLFETLRRIKRGF